MSKESIDKDWIDNLFAISVWFIFAYLFFVLSFKIFLVYIWLTNLLLLYIIFCELYNIYLSFKRCKVHGCRLVERGYARRMECPKCEVEYEEEVMDDEN